MKSTIITVAVIVLSINSASAQVLKEAQVPAEVKASVKKQFATSKVTGWEMEGANYEAHLKLNKTESSALLDPTGKLIETESEIAITALPKSVTDYLAKNHKGEPIKEAAKIVTVAGKITYEAEIKGKDLLFDEHGNLVK